MINEEKALNLSRKYGAPKNKNREIAVYQSAIEMAKWKDQQFKDYLEKKKKDIMNNPYTGHCLSDMNLLTKLSTNYLMRNKYGILSSTL